MNIILRYIDLCRFKAGPADIPSSNTLLQTTLLVYFLLGIAISRIDSGWSASVMTSLTETLFMVAFIGILLHFKGFQSRYKQTLTALAGAGIILNLVGFPLMIWLNQTDKLDQASSVAMLFIIALMFWSLMVIAHIFRQAINIKAGTAAMLTVVYTILSLLVLGLTLSGVA